MSAPDLPDDPRDWPTDPFALLGVAHGAGETDIKRAYTRLIKRFKPEHAPEQFRRVREAYELCLERFRWFAPRPTFDPPDVPVVRHADPPPAPVPDEVERLWASAVEGGDAAAYAGLAELAAARPDRADLPLRLYWLLALDPALDAGRTRHDWLAAALTGAGLRGPAAELYRRELDAAPDAALSGPYRDLLAAPAAAPDVLAVARWRLTAAGRGGAWPAVVADLTVLAGRLAFENEVGFLGYVVAALDWAAWERPQPLYGRCREEFDRLRHLGLSQSYAFDRVEETEYLAEQWRAALQPANVSITSHEPFAAAMERPTHTGLLPLVPHAWAGELTAADVDAVVGTAESPRASLQRHDQMPAGLLVLLVRALEGYWRGRGRDDESEFPPDLIRGLVRGLSGGRRGYAGLRGELLDVLLAEAIHPLEFAAACDDHPAPDVRAAARAVRDDLSLRLVWLAARIQRG